MKEIEELLKIKDLRIDNLKKHLEQKEEVIKTLNKTIEVYNELMVQYRLTIRNYEGV